MSLLANSMAAQTGIVFVPSAGGPSVAVVPGATGTVITSTGVGLTPAFQAIPSAALPLVTFVASGTVALNSMNSANAASLLTLTMPASIPAGSLIQFVAQGTGLFVVQLGAGQTIGGVGIAVPASGTLTATAQGQAVTLYAVATNTLQITVIYGGSFIAS